MGRTNNWLSYERDISQRLRGRHCVSLVTGPVADTMSEGERQPTEAVFTQLQQGNIFVDTVGVLTTSLAAYRHLIKCNRLKCEKLRCAGARARVTVCALQSAAK